MKRVIYYIMWLLGLAALSRWLNRRKLTIVLYHSTPAPSETLDRQIRYLARRYTLLPLDEAFERLQRGALPPHTLAVTFDDGYRNNYTEGYPALRRYGARATFFLTTGFVFGKQPLWIDRLKYAVKDRAAYETFKHELKGLPEEKKNERLAGIEQEASVRLANFDGACAIYAPLERSDIAEMRSRGMTFGAHTETHPILSKVSATQAQIEIRDSKEIVARACGSVSALFCYTNGQPGDWTKETERLVQEAGFAGAVTTIEGMNTPATHHYRLKRIILVGTEPIPTLAVAVSGLRGFLRRFLGA